MSLSVTFDRTGLELDPLVLTGDPEAGALYLTEDNCSWPAFTMRRTYNPDSETVAGKQLVAVTGEQGTLQLGVAAWGDEFADVKAAMDELTQATTQFSYTLTLVVDGVTIGVYEAHAEHPNWGALDSGAVRAKRQEATITIPINPPAGA